MSRISYKYGHVEKVIVKEAFTVIEVDEYDEKVCEKSIPQGTIGIIESMGYGTGDHDLHYDILFTTEEFGDLFVAIYEGSFDKWLDILSVEGDNNEEKTA
ncbi:hypothetical protein ACOMCU_00830 [Lysinibacillus sp. UGB7]|uniref:hypothetical protein n=1 Tax=Lysinibacillus sp. UGB7 TaxID=3411039 RepID=UPI003B75E65F